MIGRMAGLLMVLVCGAAAAHPGRPVAIAPVPDGPLPPPPAKQIVVTVDARTADALNHFSPLAAIGAGVDGVPLHAVPEIYTQSNVSQMLQSGLGAISYRLYTELSVQDWHWNPAGSFSEGGKQGYWTSSTALGKPTVNTFGYRLPSRGFTHDQGNDDDYSRLDDGDPTTYWKSQPYLTQGFTGDPDSTHPQWVLLDLGSKQTVNAAQIAWAAPYAVQYEVQYWTGDDPIYDPANGTWKNFPQGAVSNGTGGTVTLPLGDTGKPVRYVRVWMTQSSATCDTHDPTDPRNCVGYAVGEMGLGTLANGVFTDLVIHAPNQKQTVTYASSVDPWHSATNRVHDQEQPGLDTVFASGVTRGLPATVPVPMLYSTPANAAAEIAYLEARGDNIGRVELGEEPDGEYVLPEDDAALYVQFAVALHAVDPKLQLGGPVFQSNLHDVKTWPDANGETSWTRRFLAYLASHGHLADLSFFSFEHYPFAACGNRKTQHDLLREPGLVSNIVKIWRDDGLPAGLPMFITETNYSQNETDAAQEPAGAIWLADLAGSLLSSGANGFFFYEYEPIPLSPAYPCSGWGTYGVLQGNAHYTAQAPLAQFFAAQLLTSSWAQAVDALHTLYPATIAGGNGWIGAYPLLRPDGTYAVLLVNRDLTHAHNVQIGFTTDSGTEYFAGQIQQSIFGAAQYGWVQEKRHSHPNPDGPIAVSQTTGGAGTVYALPAASIAVLNGGIR
jgi:hypothetical protein